MLSAMSTIPWGSVGRMTDGRLYTADDQLTVNFLARARRGPVIGEAQGRATWRDHAFVAAPS